VAISLLDAIAGIQTIPGVTDKAASLAINTVATRSGMTLLRRSILEDIAFPKDYLTNDRLGLRSKATPQNLEASITARPRPTSLARFVAPGTPLGSRARIGLRVRVSKKSGGTTFGKFAWLTRLNNGNIGLALALKPGETLDNRYGEPAWLVPGRVALLYGPSVDQVFRHVSADDAPQIASLVNAEFLRQFARFTLT
jgi:hypothetical protein